MVLFENFFSVLFLYFLLEGFSGHDMPPSSMGYNQLPFAGATQTYQSSKYNILFSYRY